MNQHIVGSRYILNPATNKPWILEESLLAHIWTHKLVTIDDLYFNFDQKKYMEDSEVTSLLQPEFRLANEHFSTPSRIVNIQTSEWLKLFESIPVVWRTKIGMGNQNFQNHEFFATQGDDDNIGDVCE